MADQTTLTDLGPPTPPAATAATALPRRFKVRAGDAVTRLADGKGTRRRGGHQFGRQPVVLELDPDGNADHAAIVADPYLVVVELGDNGRPLPAELKSERLQAEASTSGEPAPPSPPAAKTTAKPPARPKSKAAKRR